MGVFYVLLLVPIIMQHFSVKRTYAGKLQSVYEKNNRNALAFFFIFLTVLVMLRHVRIGNDTRNYSAIFRGFSRMDWGQIWRSSMEVGFSYFNKIISIFTKESQVYFAVTALVTVVMIYPTYKRLCTDASLTIVLFSIMSTFIMMFSGIRQMLAVGLGCIAYELTRKKKFVSFILIVLLAMSFHVSAFMLIFMYPLYYAKITKKWLLFIIPILSVIFVFNQPIFSALTMLLERYTKYEGGIVSTGAYTMLVVFGAFAVFSFLVPDESKLGEEGIGLRNFLLLSIVVQMFAPLHTLAMRMNYYYIIFIPLLLPKVIESADVRWKQLARVGRYVMLVGFLVYFFFNAYNGKNLHVFPYHFFWEAV